MEPFLKSLAKNLYGRFGDNIKNICVVFPNRRAGMFFSKYLSETAGHTLWSPAVMTINDFVLELSDLHLSDPVDLIFETYDIYSRMVEEPESFDDFYSWGEMMIRDFDDIDKYLIDPEALFSNISDLKEIDHHFDYLTEDQQETIRKFWGHFIDKSPTAQKDNFLKIWKILFPCYQALNVQLKEKSFAYEGMIYRDVAGKIKNENFPEIPWEKVVFTGFNALNEAEKTIFRYFRDSGKGLFFWDYDNYYINNTSSEAGRFLRMNILEFPPQEMEIDTSTLGSQEITVLELPTDVSQAKYIHRLLKDRSNAELSEFHDTAIILGNEDLLIPVLSSLPENISEINITMGYPLVLTPVYSFIDRILSMQKKLVKQSGRRTGRFYYRDVLAILNHQYIRMLKGDIYDETVKDIHTRNRIYLDQVYFSGKGLAEKIFIRTDSTEGLMDYLVSLLVGIADGLPQASGDLQLEKQYIFYFLQKLRKLSLTFRKYSASIRIETFSRLLRKILSPVKIPFSGEPLGGIQIMGILETRLLDFRNIIILSVNEGVIPKSHHNFSYVPNNLRYAFGMPTTEDHDAIFAYYFFRSIQRAKTVRLAFNSRTEGVNTGEKSRYLYQILYDKKFTVTEKSIGFNISERKPEKISIIKTGEIYQILEKFSSGKSYLSPSSLNNYLDCRLRFYFASVVGLRESDEADEEIGAKNIGIILHDAMHRLYSPYTGKLVSAEELSGMLKPEVLKKAVDDAFRKEFYKTDDQTYEVIPEGQNIITYEVLTSFISKILHSDMSLAPFSIVDLEKKFEDEITIKKGDIETTVKIGGKIDRIDKRNGMFRIIDYKTGLADTKIKSVEDLFDRTKNNRNKSVFQALMYARLYKKQITDMQNLFVGLYITRGIFSEDFDPMIKLNNQVLAYSSISDEFSERLDHLISEIFDINTLFDQTDNEEKCTYCPFSAICHRNGSRKS